MANAAAVAAVPVDGSVPVPMAVLAMGGVGAPPGQEASLSINGQRAWAQLNPKPGGYSVTVFDRTTLKGVATEVFHLSSKIPASVEKFVGNSGYFMALATNHLNFGHLPVGDLYKFLTAVGAGPGLRRMELAVSQLGTSFFPSIAYALVTTLDTKDKDSFNAIEGVDFYTPVLLTLNLVPTKVDGKVIYTPTDMRQE